MTSEPFRPRVSRWRPTETESVPPLSPLRLGPHCHNPLYKLRSLVCAKGGDPTFGRQVAVNVCSVLGAATGLQGDEAARLIYGL